MQTNQGTGADPTRAQRCCRAGRALPKISVTDQVATTAKRDSVRGAPALLDEQAIKAILCVGLGHAGQIETRLKVSQRRRCQRRAGVL